MFCSRSKRNRHLRLSPEFPRLNHRNPLGSDWEPMGDNARNDEIRDNITRMRREWEAKRGALATVRRFNATLSAKGYVWFWPKIAQPR